MQVTSTTTQSSLTEQTSSADNTMIEEGQPTLLAINLTLNSFNHAEYLRERATRIGSDCNETVISTVHYYRMGNLDLDCGRDISDIIQCSGRYE